MIEYALKSSLQFVYNSPTHLILLNINVVHVVKNCAYIFVVVKFLFFQYNAKAVDIS